MESSEDDAGTATSASRRASAREKDVQQAENVDATSCYQQGSSEPRVSCQTPAMSEDNFDGDSVPSPSTQDVNTSTEAILDMIDEIVDGPGAPKRLPPLVQEDSTTVADKCASTSSSFSQCEPDGTGSNCRNSQPLPQSLTPTTSAKSENSECGGIFDTPPECVSDTGTTVGVDNSDNIDALASSSVPECGESALTKQPQVQALVNPELELSAACLLSNIPSSGEVKTIKQPVIVREFENLERTIKCVTSSDNHDNVVLESAESTSSDSSVSEFKVTPVEHLTRSPLRRRLVRPAPSDRRPDSTVSSTVDSQTINVYNIHPGQSNCGSVAKDVSSSSDAVHTVHANIKPAENRNVSEISICKAETSMSSPKKIKLIRQKVTPITIKKDYGLDEEEALLFEEEPCQSTSSENSLTSLEPSAESSTIIGTTKPQGQDVKPLSCNDSTSGELPIEVSQAISGSSKENQDDNEIEPNPSPDDEKSDVSVDQKLIPPIKLSLCALNSLETITLGKEDDKINEKTDDNDCNSSSDDKKANSLVESNVCVSNSPKSNEDVIETEKLGISAITKEDLNIIAPPDVNKDAKPSLSTTLTSSIAQESTDKSASIYDEEKKVPPIILNLSASNLSDPCMSKINVEKSSSNLVQEDSECTKQVPKLTIKLNTKQTEEMKSPVPKVTIKPIKPPSEEVTDIKMDSSQSIPTITKLNIKPILKPPDNINDTSLKTHVNTDHITVSKDQIPSVTKLNIKPIPRPPEKINDFHRKSSSSEISESEYSENDETTSTSDQASASDQGPPDIVPKVTIKLGKPGTQSEGKFYTEQNIPKLTIKAIQQTEKVDQDPGSMLKLVISQSDEKQLEKIPKLTIKNVSKADGQPLSPKLTIKSFHQTKAPENVNRESEIAKLKIASESFSSSTEVKENAHVPKITIKTVTRTDTDTGSKTPKKSAVHSDSTDYIPVVTKLNIKPILKPTDEGETSESVEDKVPVVSKLNIKPVIKPKVNELDSSVEDVPKIIKLNIKPLNSPEENTSEEKDCDVLNADNDENSIPVITKLNIKPIVKPTEEEDTLKDSENQSSEAGNSSDDNTEYIPIVTKLNIKPIIKPNDEEVTQRPVIPNDQNIPVITKLNIKPLIKPEESASPSSPKKDNLKNPDLRNCAIPVVTKLNIKPVIKPEIEHQKTKVGGEEKSAKHPPLLMKINMKAVADTSKSETFLHSELICNNLSENVSSIHFKHVNHSSSDSLQNLTQIDEKNVHCDADKSVLVKHTIDASLESIDKLNINLHEVNSDMHIPKKEKSSNVIIENSLPADELLHHSSDSHESVNASKNFSLPAPSHPKAEKINLIQICEANESIKSPKLSNVNTHGNKGELIKILSPGKQKTSSVQNCTLLKKLLENTKEGLDRRFDEPSVSVSNCTGPDKTESFEIIPKHVLKCDPGAKDLITEKVNCDISINNEHKNMPVHKNDINCSLGSPKHQELHNALNENLTKPLEIIIPEKISNQSSGQDSPRIILKINKTDHGPSAKIITEETKRPDLQQNHPENTQELVNDKQNQKRLIMNSRRKQTTDAATNMPMGKRLRSSRIVESTEKSPVKRNVGKRPPSLEISSPQNKESDLSVLETKRLKLGQLLSANKSLTITPVSRITQISPTKTAIETKQGVKTVNHSILNNENCSKNGNSKLHKILSNLQAKQMQTMPLNDTNCLEKNQSLTSEVESNTSTGSDTVEVVENCHPEVQEMIINENTDFRDFGTGVDELSQDPLEVDNSKTVSDCTDDSINIPKTVELTPQPKKRGRPRKLPVSEGAKPVSLPVSALEERPQRSLRLMRDRPAILTKPRGRGRGRGGRRSEPTPPPELDPEPESVVLDDTPGTIDPTSSRIKLPRMTEALDKMPGACSTPLTSRRRRSSAVEMKLFDSPEPNIVLDSLKLDEDMKCPEVSVRGRGGRGSRGGGRGAGAARGRTPRGRGRGRGGGRGAMYMKETMGIYGRVCGPATTTVQLFEEETCMMDDNATPAKPSHLLDEDSQSSVKSSTNESNKMKKSKFADLFDSNKVWTAADVKEYTWPPPERPDVEHQIMMIQEQVAMFLSVKSFKRRYPELKRRTIGGEERDYVLSRGLVTEALCDLGITAVDASEVLDIMLSDYPHKYEEYRSYQRQRQLTEPEEAPEVKTDDKASKVEIRTEQKSVDHKPEPPKVDPEKLRQDMAAAAIASASEWNALMNSLRRPACADLQSLTIQRRRVGTGAGVGAGPGAGAGVPTHVRPPTGFYPHALLPGQYQHYYRHYTPDQLRYYPLNTALEAPSAIAGAGGGAASPALSSSDSEPEWGGVLRGSSSDDSAPHHHHAAKRKKLTKVKRSSQAEAVPGTSKDKDKEDSRDAEVETCRVCKLRLEANRKYTHERFLVCANCNAKLHPGCVDLSADTVRKCREYAWQCADCKACGVCARTSPGLGLASPSTPTTPTTPSTSSTSSTSAASASASASRPSARDGDKMLFCDLCDRGFHVYCVALRNVPSGRWHCVECAICKSCGAREPSGAGPASSGAPSDAEWHHQTRRGPGGHKIYSHSLCTPCARVR